jgi:hypothetical protein
LVNHFERSEDESLSGLLRRWDHSLAEWAWAVYAGTGCYSGKGLRPLIGLVNGM